MLDIGFSSGGWPTWSIAQLCPAGRISHTMVGLNWHQIRLLPPVVEGVGDGKHTEWSWAAVAVEPFNDVWACLLSL